MCNYSNEKCNRKKKKRIIHNPSFLFFLNSAVSVFARHPAWLVPITPRGEQMFWRVSRKCHTQVLKTCLWMMWKEKKRNAFPPAQWPQAWVHTRRGRVQVCPLPVGDTVVSHTAESSESKVMWWVSNSDVTWKCEGDETSSLTVTDYNATEAATNIGYNNLHTLSLPTPEGCITER